MKHPEVLAGLVLLAVLLVRADRWLRRREARHRRYTWAGAYAAYMRSGTWRRKRTACLRAAGYRCAARGCWRRAVTAHHPDYRKRLGSESWRELVALCWPHHRAIHDRHRRLRHRGVTLRQVTWDVVGGRGGWWAA